MNKLTLALSVSNWDWRAAYGGYLHPGGLDWYIGTSAAPGASAWITVRMLSAAAGHPNYPAGYLKLTAGGTYVEATSWSGSPASIAVEIEPDVACSSGGYGGGRVRLLLDGVQVLSTGSVNGFTGRLEESLSDLRFAYQIWEHPASDPSTWWRVVQVDDWSVSGWEVDATLFAAAGAYRTAVNAAAGSGYELGYWSDLWPVVPARLAVSPAVAGGQVAYRPWPSAVAVGSRDYTVWRRTSYGAWGSAAKVLVGSPTTLSEDKRQPPHLFTIDGVLGLTGRTGRPYLSADLGATWTPGDAVASEPAELWVLPYTTGEAITHLVRDASDGIIVAAGYLLDGEVLSFWTGRGDASPGLSTRCVVAAGVRSAGEAAAVPWPYVMRLPDHQAELGVFSGARFRSWRGPILVGTYGTWSLYAEQALTTAAELTSPTLAHGADGSQAVAGYGQGAMVVYWRPSPEAAWQGPYLSYALATSSAPYLLQIPDGTWEVGWVQAGTWHRWTADHPTGTWSAVSES